MKLVKQLMNAAVAVGATAATGLAMAQTASGIDISAATDSAKTDITKAGGLIVGVVVAIAAISWIRRVIK